MSAVYDEISKTVLASVGFRTGNTNPSSFAIFGTGMGLHIVLQKMVKVLRSAPILPLIFVVDCASDSTSLVQLPDATCSITSPVPPAKRRELYSEAGVFVTTTRILLTDLLTSNLVPELIKGIVLVNAEAAGHQEMFVIRKFPETNRTGFLICLSDKPTRLRNFYELQRALFIPNNVYLYPRFHQLFQTDKFPITSLKVAMTPGMRRVDSLVKCLLTNSLEEIRSSLKKVDAATLRSLSEFRSDDLLDRTRIHELRQLLTPHMRDLPPKVKAVLRDIPNLRHLLLVLTRHTALGFLRHMLDFEEQSVKLNAPWIFSADAQALLKVARLRVFGDGKDTVASEVSPKFASLADLVSQLVGERNAETSEELQEPSSKKPRLLNEENSSSAMNPRVVFLTGCLSQKKEVERCLNFGAVYATLDSLRQYVQHTDRFKHSELSRVDKAIEDCLMACVTGIDWRVELSTSPDMFQVIESFRPDAVVLLEPDLAALRHVETWRRGSSITPSRDVKIIVMMVSDSLELANIDQERVEENLAFNDLIIAKDRTLISVEELYSQIRQQKSLLAEAPKSNRRADNSTLTKPTPTVYIDIRELRSSLPFFLYKCGLEVIPVTLSIGDYIVSRDISIERKSLPDLTDSLRSGRLYKQALNMTQVYSSSALLVEIDRQHIVTFIALEVKSTFDGINRKSVLTQLLAMTLHFPNLQLLWSFDPRQTAELFASLKHGRYEPSVIKEDTATAADDQTVGLEMLKKFPGINAGNHKSLLSCTRSLKDIINMREQELATALGKKSAKELGKFFHKSLDS